MQKLQNFINGQLRAPMSNRYLKNIQPATGLAYSEIPDSDELDVQESILAAEKASSHWQSLSIDKRSHILRKIADHILENAEDLAQAECFDTGKPISMCRELDIPRSARNFSFFADLMISLHGETYQNTPQELNYTLYQALGVVACISPWNLPLYLLTWKIAPALAAGNTVVAKPSELSPMTAFLLGKICQKAGLPDGVLNIVHGLGNKVGSSLVKHPKIKAISFTGSTRTGRWISENTSGQFKKLALEMGGKNAFIVFADADLEKASDMAIRAAFSNQGQICLCGSRLLVEESIYEKFKDLLLNKVRKIKIGDPSLNQTDFGSLISAEHLAKVQSYISLAQQEGGKILYGGKAPKFSSPDESVFQKGFFMEPTLIEGLSEESRCNQEEIFGPVVSLMSFQNEQAAIKIANSTAYGLAFSVWTENLSRSQRLAAKLQCGIVWINTWMKRDLRTPFGGIKDSGFGREGGLEALKFFSEIKNICIFTENL